MADVYDEMINDINTQKKATQTQINNLATEKQNILNTYEQNYAQQLADYNNLMEQQRGNIDTWAEQQRQTQQAQTDFNLGLIDQQKQEAQKQTNAEIGNAYIDYQRGLNQFGGSAETLASQGLGGTGFAKNQDIAMNITYQNRVATAKSALMKANQDYDNQMQQARLNNDAQLAETAYKQMQQQYALALQGFEYKTTMQNNRLNYIQSINDSYFNKTNTLQNRLDDYNSSINSVKISKQSSYSSGGSGGSGGYYYTDTPKTTTTTQTKSSGGITGMVNNITNAIQSAISSTKNGVTAKNNPALSGSAASNWYKQNIGGKTMSITELKNKLANAPASVTDNDIRNILNSYGIKS